MASTASYSGLSRRPVAFGTDRRSPAGPGGRLHPDVGPTPRAPAWLQLAAFAFIVLFACLQLLPATHVRHPADRHRTWIPVVQSNRTASPLDSGDNPDLQVKKIHIYSWINCLDLRMVAVLANSTLSSARYPEHVYFHFILPEGEDKELPYYKLKVLFPRSNLEIIRQEEIKEKVRTRIPDIDIRWSSLSLIAPLIIANMNPSLGKFVYVSPDTIVKGNIEELIGIDLGSYAIAAAENCTKRLGDYVSLDILNAIHRTSAKSWLSKGAYDQTACFPDLNLVLLDARRMEKNLLEAISWWIKVLNLGNERIDQINPAITVALYERYLKLPTSWKVGDAMPSVKSDEAKVIQYDGPRKACSEDNHKQHRSSFGDTWHQYLSPKSDAILSH